MSDKRTEAAIRQNIEFLKGKLEDLEKHYQFSKLLIEGQIEENERLLKEQSDSKKEAS